MKFLALLVSSLMMAAAHADHAQDEHRLLQSWGFQSINSGRLVFRNNGKPQSVYQPWTPELGRVQLPPPRNRAQTTLQPLVVSAKKKNTE